MRKRDLFAELQASEAGLALAYALFRKYGDCWQPYLDDRFEAYERAGRCYRKYTALAVASRRPMLTAVS